MPENKTGKTNWHNLSSDELVKYITLVQVEGIRESQDNSGLRTVEVTEPFWTLTDPEVTLRFIDAHLSQGYSIFEPEKDEGGTYIGPIILTKKEQIIQTNPNLPNSWTRTDPHSGPRLWRPGPGSTT